METHFPCSRTTIRQATTQDAKAVRMLIPELREASACFIATDDANRVIGAAGATRSFRSQSPVGPGISIYVIEACRRQGIGRNLLQCLERTCADAGAYALYGIRRIEKGSGAERAWNWLGFTAYETVEVQRLPLDQFEPRLAPLIDRMQKQHRIPATAEIIPLFKSNLGAVLALHLDNLGGDRAELYRKLRGRGPGAFHPRYSRVLLLDGKVVGCILAHRKDADTAIVDADVVNSNLRGGWANIWLKLEATRGALRLGIKNFEFTSFDHYTDTRSFTKKMGGVTVLTTLLMVKRLIENSPEEGEQ
jgi:N-acetylglutamate synthase-like GNAT family acetyltransferase